MSRLKWRIIDKPSTCHKKFDFEFSPTNHFIYNFIMFAPPSFCPKLILSCIEERGFVFNESWGLTFYSDLDEGELANGVSFNKGNVKIIGFSENLIIDENTLFELVLDFSLKVLETYKDHIDTQIQWHLRYTEILSNKNYEEYIKNFDENWNVSMISNIKALKKKIFSKS